DTNALRVGFHWPFYHRWLNRVVSRRARGRCSRARHVFRHRSFSLHHGGRHGDGVHGWPSLLVAKNFRTLVSGIGRQTRSYDHIHRIQSDVLPTVYSWLPWSTAPLPRLSAGVPNLSCALDCRRFHPGRRIFNAADLFHLGMEAWSRCRAEPMASDWFGMANAFAAART